LNLRSTKNKRKSKRPQKKKGQKQLQLWLRQLVPSPSHGDKKENLTTFNSVYKYLKGKEVGKVHVVSTPQMPALLETNPESINKKYVKRPVDLRILACNIPRYSYLNKLVAEFGEIEN
jgi:hypothetical protein